MKKDTYFITESARIRFKKWLVDKNLTVNKFAPMCGCSRQYLEQILAAKKRVTARVRQLFRNGGYPYL